MTDTPIHPETVPPPRWPDTLKSFIGDLARPFALYSIAGATSWAIFVGKDAGIVTSGGVILALLYGAKAVEIQQQGKRDADVAIAQAKAGVTP